ncbi:MAG: hypothetical protein JSS49_09860 [Planctomycetes bacterium]|nr:hypothetical protein [Planctomycetota bacterium]
MPTFEYEFSEVRTTEMLQRCYQLQKTNWYFQIGLSATLVLLAVFQAILQEYLTTAIYIAVLAAILAIYPVFSRWNLQSSVRAFSKSPFWNQKYRIELSSDSLGTFCSLAENKSSWSSFTSARRFDDGIVLFQGQVMHWIPFDALIAGTADEAEELVRANIADYQSV